MEEIKILHRDEVAEWLRRWTANPMGSARVGSNPILVDVSLLFLCPMVGRLTPDQKVACFIPIVNHNKLAGH